MLSFSVNPNIHNVDLGSIDFSAHDDVSREWLGEVYCKAVENNIGLDVSLTAYAYKCQQYTQINVEKREVAILSTNEYEAGYRGVTDVIASYIDENIDNIAESDEIISTVEQAIELQDYFMVEEGISFWRVLSLAKQGCKVSIERLRNLSQQYSMQDFMTNLLGNPECIEILGGVMGC